MEYCFLEKILDVNILIEQLGEFEEFCPKEEIVATDETVQYYSKGNPNVLTRKNREQRVSCLFSSDHHLLVFWQRDELHCPTS
jgi:hypothetical protein